MPEPEPRPAWMGVASLLVLGAVAAIAAYTAAGRLQVPQAVPIPVAAVVDTTATPGVLVVHVSGAVPRPGLVQVPSGSRVADAVVAAGGALPTAALDAVNLAEPLEDAQHVHVPEVGAETPAVPGGGGGAVTADGKVRVNTATAAELETLPGIGPVLAERIVEHRDTIGRFETVEDLLDVSGIGERMLANLRNRVVVP